MCIHTEYYIILFFNFAMNCSFFFIDLETKNRHKHDNPYIHVHVVTNDSFFVKTFFLSFLSIPYGQFI